MRLVACKMENVTKTYAGRVILENFNLEILSGEVVAITGNSGVGKSTVLNILGLLETADTGSVSLFGSAAPKVGSRSARQYLKNKIGYLFQNFALIDSDTVEQNLKVAQKFNGSRGSEKALDRENALAAFGMRNFNSRKIYSLSGGEQQRIAIARLLLKKCDLILADEPTGSLDQQNRDFILQKLFALRAQGKTIVVVTHDEFVANLCDRVISL